jgi:Rrf2 family protein
VQLGEGVEWALHCCTVLALVPADRTMSAARLAEFHQVPPTYLAKHLQALAQAGIVESLPGRKGGYRLARPVNDISLLDVVEAIDGDAPTFRCTEIRRRGPAAVPAREYTTACGIQRAMDRADAAWRAELARTTVADLLGTLAESVSPVAVRKAAAWYQEAIR